MNLTLLKMDIGRYWKLFLGIFLLLMLYFTVMIQMFHPENMGAISGMMGMFPKEMVNMMGMGGDPTSMTGMIANFFYGFLAYLIPTIYMVIVANGLVAKLVDQGSIVNLLASPHSRLEIIFTQAGFLLCSILDLFLLFTLCGLAASHFIRPGELETGAFFLLNLSVLLVFFALSGLSFFFSCVCDESSRSLLFGAGIPLLLFVMKMVSQLGGSLSRLAPYTLYGLFPPGDILSSGNLPILPVIACLFIGALGYGGGILSFCRRDLSL